MTRSRSFQVKDVARVAGVSVRTLHHYDAIGLLVPRHRTDAGYRLYIDADLLMRRPARSRLARIPLDAAVMDVAERHRQWIDGWFYPCSHQMQRDLASMYEADERFRQTIDKQREGLASFLAEAIRANARRHSS